MYDHIGLRVGNLDASVRFYTAALAPLGFVLCSRDDAGAGFGPKDAPALWLHLHKGSAGSAAHVAFRAKDHAAIKQFHAEGLKAGGRDNGGAGLRADYSPRTNSARDVRRLRPTRTGKIRPVRGFCDKPRAAFQNLPKASA